MPKRIIVASGLVVIAVAIFAYMQRGERDGIEPLTLHGHVDIREVDLGFRVSGRVARMLHEEGDRVEAGDALAQLDDEPYVEALTVAEARVAQAAARVDWLRAGSRPQEIERAEASVNEASAALRHAEQALAREHGLDERGLTAQSLVDQAVARRDEARARLRAAEEARDLARAGAREEEIAEAVAGLAVAAAEAERARTAAADTRLAAPSSGTLITRVREPGAIVAAGEPVYTLSLDEPVWVRAYVEQPDLGKVAPGMPAHVTTDSSPRRYPAQVGFVSPRAEFTPRPVETARARADLVYRVRVIVTAPDAMLRQGMPVKVVFDAQAGSGGDAG